jgi:predicted TIM-barrel fold metal-dependent hydrolase
MDRKNIRAMVNLTGGYEQGLIEAVAKYDRQHPGRFYTFAEPSYSHFKEPDYPKLQAQAIEQAHRDGARGLKILKTLGLYLRENITAGTLVKIDDPRFDPMWDACGQLNLPVTLHVGNFSENLQDVAENLDRFPNMLVDIAARVGELGRQPVTARNFFDKYQDRILFATDATPHGDEFPQQVFNDQLYEIYYRFLETEDEYFDYAPAKIPILPSMNSPPTALTIRTPCAITLRAGAVTTIGGRFISRMNI